MIKKAMILAAGFGKRIHPLTLDLPKPLLEIGKETLLSNTLNFLELLEIEEAIINLHYLSEKIVNYIKKKKFKIKINLIFEKEKILDTGGGVLNAIDNFSNLPFYIINPDTVWSKNYFKEVKLMESYSYKNNKCTLLVVNKKKSFDSFIKGDFNLDKNIISRRDNSNLEYIYTGLQIMKPEVFKNINDKVFSINKIWDKLILNEELHGLESNIDFLHVSRLDIYKKLITLKH